MNEKEQLQKSIPYLNGSNGSHHKDEITTSNSLNSHETRPYSYQDLQNEDEPDTLEELRRAGIKFGKSRGSIWKPGDRNVV